MDPSFLAALPEDIRREVLQNQLGIRPPSRPPVATSLPTTTAPVLAGPGVTEVSPEFLAALPPAIQEEVSCCHKTIHSVFIFTIYSVKGSDPGVAAFDVVNDKCSRISRILSVEICSHSGQMTELIPKFNLFF